MPPRATDDTTRPNGGPVLRLKVRLLDISPMIWRRLLVPAETSLRELHGILQVAMGWEGLHLFQFHLRAVRYGSHELSAASPEATLKSFRLRPGSRFVYEYDLNAPWRHEVRVEPQLEREREEHHPLCLDGHGDCPAEGGGGPAGYLARQHDALGGGAMGDLGTITEVLEEVLRTRTTAALDGPGTRRDFEAALGRLRERGRFLPRPVLPPRGQRPPPARRAPRAHASADVSRSRRRSVNS